MVWVPLGSVSVGLGYQSFSSPLIGKNVVLLQHQTGLQNAVAIGYLAQYFASPDPGVRVVPDRRIYSSDVGQIIEFGVPDGFSDLGLAVWDLQIRARFPFDRVDWVVSASYWSG